MMPGVSSVGMHVSTFTGGTGTMLFSSAVAVSGVIPDTSAVDDSSCTGASNVPALLACGWSLLQAARTRLRNSEEKIARVVREQQ
ncbi:hypothetical protein HB779_06785 [Phyllobacterium sp. 628]|uniref:hypothetical protein n=1 Tax=Phyllobacterium sp. 628 TaxID=2718938 RepID=UPI00166265FE|nr:hypothetical protein [Phyllobacterium sp. 628]QND51635.1 hypothetical protein HB779_06785 [Phyllobacterium sp. 628]